MKNGKIGDCCKMARCKASTSERGGGLSGRRTSERGDNAADGRFAAVPTVVLKEGRYIRLLRQGEWEFVCRKNCTGIVIILAMTEEQNVLFVEQYRLPVAKNVIEFPAGLVNDLNLKKKETILNAARRELWEETGYRARRIVKVMDGPSSGGSSSDIITIVMAKGLKKVSAGGGDETEAITVHEIPLDKADPWLAQKRKTGCLIDPKIYAGLYFLKKYNGENSNG